VSKEAIKSIYEAAYMETEWDSEGDIRIKDEINCFALLSEAKDRIQLIGIFGFNPKSSMAQRLECVNKINTEYIMVKATAGGNDSLQFRFDICIAGGITKKNLVLATKRFLSIPRDAALDDCPDILA
jgi:hypothetical protein